MSQGDYTTGDYNYTVRHKQEKKLARDLTGCPDHIVEGYFFANGAHLTSLKGGPSVVDFGYLCKNNKLTTLEGIAGVIGGLLEADRNYNLTTLIGIHKMLKSIGEDLYLTGSPVVEGGLGLLLVAGFKNCYVQEGFNEPFLVIGKYATGNKADIFRCQKELIDRDYEEYARL